MSANEYVPTEDEAFLWLDRLDDAVKRHAYDCDCQVGGVDAMSIDTDWLRHALTEIRHAYRGHAERLALSEDRAFLAESQVEAIRDLHESDGHGAGCGERDCYPSCLECDEDFPCATIRALDSELEEQ